MRVDWKFEPLTLDEQTPPCSDESSHFPLCPTPVVTNGAEEFQEWA